MRTFVEQRESVDGASGCCVDTSHGCHPGHVLAGAAGSAAGEDVEQLHRRCRYLSWPSP